MEDVNKKEITDDKQEKGEKPKLVLDSIKCHKKEVELKRTMEADNLVKRLRKEAQAREKRRLKATQIQNEAHENEERLLEMKRNQEQKRALQIKMVQLERRRQEREARAIERQRQYEVRNDDLTSIDPTITHINRNYAKRKLNCIKQQHHIIKIR